MRTGASRKQRAGSGNWKTKILHLLSANPSTVQATTIPFNYSGDDLDQNAVVMKEDVCGNVRGEHR